MAVDDSQDSEWPTVEQSLGDEVYRPGVVGTTDCRAPYPTPARSTPARLFSPDRQAIFAVQPIDPLVVRRSAFPAQQHVQAPVTVAYSRGRKLLQPHPQRRLRIPD
jgi:hypothetical protein